MAYIKSRTLNLCYYITQSIHTPSTVHDALVDIPFYHRNDENNMLKNYTFKEEQQHDAVDINSPFTPHIIQCLARKIAMRSARSILTAPLPNPYVASFEIDGILTARFFPGIR